MNNNEIIDSVNKHYKLYPYPFYKKILEKIKNNGQDTNMIDESPEILEGVRLNVCYNSDKYKIVISDKEKPQYCYRKIKIDKQGLKNTICQLIGIEKQILFYADDAEYQKIKQYLEKTSIKLNNDKICYVVYVYFIEKSITMDDVLYESAKNIYEIASLVLGIDSLYLMEHQRLDRINEFFNSGEKIKVKPTELIIEYNEKLKKLDWKEREKIMIFSGVVLHLLGTTYTNDVDLLIIASNDDKSYFDKMAKIFPDDDIHVLLKDGTWYKQNEILEYQKQWLTYILPRMGNADDIFDVFANPKHHFYYMGMKVISVNITIKRLIARIDSSSIPDMIMLKKVNNIDIKDDICFPNMNIKHGTVFVYSQETINNIYKNIQKKMKEWHNYNMTLDEISNTVKRCNESAENIYQGDIPEDKITKTIKQYHDKAKQLFITKYANNSNLLVDVGSGHLRDYWYWKDARVKHIIAIEPSKQSIEKWYNKKKTDLNIDVINGKGDDDWTKNTKYNMLMDVKADVITFMFTIHYMIKNMDIVMENIKNISKRGTKVIIFCLDGNQIVKYLEQYHGKYEVRDSSEPIYGIYYMDKPSQQILVYFRGTYGVNKGSIEYIVDLNKLEQTFKKNNFSLVEKKNVADIRQKITLDNKQRLISKLHVVLVFSKD